MDDRLLNPLEVSRCIKLGMAEVEQIDAILIAQNAKTLKQVGEMLD